LGFWVREKFQLDQFHLFCVNPINLVRILHVENKRKEGDLRTEGGNAVEDFENLLMVTLLIDLTQQLL
jgi:hypothetical protein